MAEAEKKLWEQTEDVRKLQAAMFLSDVLAERQGQLQSQQQAKDLGTKANQQFHDFMLANLKVRKSGSFAIPQRRELRDFRSLYDAQ